MGDMDAIQVARDLMYYGMLLAMPSLALSLAVGLLVSIFQAVTSIQEQTLSFVPRLVAVVALLVVTMPWMLQMFIYFTHQMFARAVQVAR